jgi:hypothetical protein
MEISAGKRTGNIEDREVRPGNTAVRKSDFLPYKYDTFFEKMQILGASDKVNEDGMQCTPCTYYKNCIRWQEKICSQDLLLERGTCDLYSIVSCE